VADDSEPIVTKPGELVATSTYALFLGSTGTFTVPVPGSPEQVVILLGFQKDVPTSQVYVRTVGGSNDPYAYLQMAGSGGSAVNPVVIPSGTKEIEVNIVTAATSLVFFFHVS
jgi:hypothetical protein